MCVKERTKEREDAFFLFSRFLFLDFPSLSPRGNLSSPPPLRRVRVPVSLSQLFSRTVGLTVCVKIRWQIKAFSQGYFVSFDLRMDNGLETNAFSHPSEISYQARIIWGLS